MQFERGKVLLDRIRKIFTLKIGEEEEKKFCLIAYVNYGKLFLRMRSSRTSAFSIFTLKIGEG